MAAVALTEPGHAGPGYDVTGPEALSYTDVAAPAIWPPGKEVLT